MSKTKIEWAEATWNPVTGCTPISEGCRNCYAKRMVETGRLKGSKRYPDGFKVTHHPDRLTEPLRWRKPRRVFVCSMGDLFHEDVDPEFRLAMFGVMAMAPQHVFLLLTKRILAARRFIDATRTEDITRAYRVITEGQNTACFRRWKTPFHDFHLPPHIWVGATVEDNRAWQNRVPVLSQLYAHHKFVSFEPLLDHIKFPTPIDTTYLHNLSWAIIGGESGPNAREMQQAWARSLIGYCRVFGCPVFMKQLGSCGRKDKGNKPETWPPELQFREVPSELGGGDECRPMRLYDPVARRFGADDGSKT